MIDVIIPPSIPMIIYAIAAQQSATTLFFAGIVPGLIVASALSIYVMARARVNRIPLGEPARWRNIAQAMRSGVWSLLAPVVILGGIYGGLFTPTEAAGVACIYAIIVSVYVHRELAWSDVWDILRDSAVLVGQIMIIVSAAGAYAWFITTSGFASSLVAAVAGLKLHTWSLLLVIKPRSAVCRQRAGASGGHSGAHASAHAHHRTSGVLIPIHFGIVVTDNLAIGMFLPPFGLNLFASHALFWHSFDCALPRRPAVRVHLPWRSHALDIRARADARAAGFPQMSHGVLCGYDDLRGFIDQVRSSGDLRDISGANSVDEVGAITEVAAGRPDCPALLFDNIPGFAAGFRIFSNATVHARRAALALGIDVTLTPLEALKVWRDRRSTLRPIEPVVVEQAAFLENSRSGSDVDISIFPAPRWHGKDGGLYIGSGSLIIMRDPDTGWINASIYRVQVHGKSRVTIQFDHRGRHGNIIAQKYWDRGQSCPVAIVSGEDPALFIAGFEYLPAGHSEYGFAGAIKRRAVEVHDGPLTGLPLPARAEIILEGYLVPPSQFTLPEGPFGEFTGYYASEARPAPVMEVEAMHYRNQPILLGSPPMKPPRFHFGLPFRAASIWGDLDASGVTDVVGVWQHVSQLMTVVALEQRYAGHAKRAGLIAAANSYMGSFDRGSGRGRRPLQFSRRHVGDHHAR